MEIRTRDNAEQRKLEVTIYVPYQDLVAVGTGKKGSLDIVIKMYRALIAHFVEQTKVKPAPQPRFEASLINLEMVEDIKKKTFMITKLSKGGDAE